MVLKDNEAAIVFNEDGMRLYCPDMPGDEIVPEHIYSAMCYFIMLTDHRDEIQPVLDDIGSEIEKD